MAKHGTAAFFCFVFISLAILGIPGFGTSGMALAENEVFIIELEGPINPGTAMYVIRGLEKAAEQGAGLAILRLDTPGGLASSMRTIIKAILNSPIP
ncbi:MAG: nodulation protein NfeD, partial [Desulfobacteraceae bacterium]